MPRVPPRSRKARALPGISVIIPAHNEEATIEQTLRAVLAQRSPKLEVLVLADDCSDRTIPIARFFARRDPRVRVLPNQKRLGLAGSLNRGIARSRYPVICTLHADCVPRGRDWLSRMAAALSADPLAGAVGCNQVIPRRAFEKLTLSEKLLVLHTVEGRIPLVRSPRRVRFTNNKGDLYDRALLNRIGGFGSAHFRVAGEDADLCLRIRAAGRHVIQAPPILEHLEGSHARGLKNFLRKQLQYSDAQGALKRIWGSGYRLQPWNTVTKTAAYLLQLAWPTLLWPLAGLGLLAILAGIATTLRRGRGLLPLRELAQLPLLRIAADACNILGFWHGLLTGRQSL